MFGTHLRSSWEGGYIGFGRARCPPPGNTPVPLHEDSMFVGWKFEHGRETLVGAINRRPVCNTCFCLVANNFVRPQSSADYGYYAYGEVSHFVYCLLQKIKQSSVLPLVEKWEEYMTPNHSKFAAIEEDRFLAGTRVSSALEKVGSAYLKKEFRRDCRNFLEDFVSCVLSTVAARSSIGQGLSCFCPPVLIGGDDHAPLQLLDLLLDGLLAKGWVRCGDMEACKSEYQSFVQEQRLLERTSTRGRLDVGNVLTFCSSQAGFPVRSHLYKVCISFHTAGC